MKLNYLLLALLCWLPRAAVAQQAQAPAAASSAQSPAPQPTQIQPQVWPPAQSPAQAQSAPVPAETAAAQRPSGQTTPSGEIQLDVVVTDKAGNPVAGLQRGDFTLLDDNHPAQIESLQAYGGSGAAPQHPTQIFLIIDAVNVGFQQVSYSRFGIDQFLRSDSGRLANPVSIYWYTDSGLTEGAPASTDGNELAAKLDATEGQLRTLNRAAGAWGAIERFDMSVRTMTAVAHTAAGEPGRKLLIWIGPGWPMLDNPNIQMSWKDQQGFFANIVELSTDIREAQMQIYSVSPGMPGAFTYLYESYTKGVKKASQAYLPDLDLKVLAIQSGGQVIPPSNDLGSEIEKCARDAGAYYTIRFTPPRADGPNEYHELKVRVDKPGLTARTDTGYYNQPPQVGQ